jgi:hypothetical protein
VRHNYPQLAAAPYIFSILFLIPRSLLRGSSFDKGVNVGLPFLGKAPDIGAFEYSPTSMMRGVPVQKTGRWGNASSASIRIVDITGRSIYSGTFHRTSGVLIYQIQRPDKSVCTWPVVQMQ